MVLRTKKFSSFWRKKKNEGFVQSDKDTQELKHQTDNKWDFLLKDFCFAIT